MRGPPSDDLIALLADAAANPTSWEFFALVRAVEQLALSAPPVGTALDPADEALDLAHEPSLSFPRTTVAGFDADRRRPRVRSLMLGLTGPMGAMPLQTTEIAMMECSGRGPRPFGDFLDLVSARMLQGFYRAWADAEPCAQADRPADDRFASYLGAASGAVSLRFVSKTERGAPDAPDFGDWRRLAYGGHLSSLRSAASVGDLLAHVTERPVTVDELVGRWRDIPADAHTRIGRRGRYNALGTGATLGARFFAVEWDVTIRLPARDMADLERILPGGELHALLGEAVGAALPGHLDWYVRIEIDEAAITPARLGTARLGMTGWVSPRKRTRTRSDVRLASRTGRLARKPKTDRAEAEV